MSEKKTVFMICPVRGITDAEKKYLSEFIHDWETPRYKLHYPPRDTNQDDLTGLNICKENRAAIKKSESIILFYNPTSTGTYFDIGMVFSAEKPLSVLNPEALGKKELSSLEKFIITYAESGFITREIPGLDNYPGVDEVQILNDHYNQVNIKAREERRGVIKQSLLVPYEWKNNNSEFLFDFGMTFMLEKTIVLKNRDYLESQRTPHKSFQNVLLELDKR